MFVLFQKLCKQIVRLGDVCERICKKQCSEVVIVDITVTVTDSRYICS